jgi:hypothetical protein
MPFKSPRASSQVPFALLIDDTVAATHTDPSPIPPAPPLPQTPPTNARRRTTTVCEATLMIGEWMSSIMSEVRFPSSVYLEVI